MDVIPTVRATLPRVSVDRLHELRDMPYRDYLRTPEWRKTRDGALQRASYRCERCPAKRPLQVHHVRYERLGAELETDLEVLCQPCHEGHHFDESRRSNLGVYVKLASEALRDPSASSYTDLTDVVKTLCREYDIPVHDRRIAIAIDQVGHRLSAAPAPVRVLPRPAPGPAISRQDAAGILRWLGITVGLRSMPAPASFLWQQRAADNPTRVEYDRY